MHYSGNITIRHINDSPQGINDSPHINKVIYYKIFIVYNMFFCLYININQGKIKKKNDRKEIIKLLQLKKRNIDRPWHS